MAIDTLVVEISCDLTKPRNLRALSLSGKELFKVCHHPAKFVDHRHCGSGDTMVVVCHMILQEH